jgi:hypothetical protein
VKYLATSFTALRDDLKKSVQFYKTPIAYTDDTYNYLLEQGIKRYYTDLNLMDKYSAEYVEMPNQEILVNYNIKVQEYIKTAARIEFFTQVKGDAAQLFSYSTNALSVTGGDKPYKNISNDITLGEDRLTELFFKIVDGAGSVGE